ncbi:MAG: DUF3185 domain-containing protein [Candidatus Omnitrophica bacterium CG11_big_fil_rev_8_21_14_0_20_64_10]|nr:MAG: DUF3185 domain-containing protein [Candidatus Omnitrophica bacterium CG11_big_fil_rev_8_21_14_0_20_64_10]
MKPKILLGVMLLVIGIAALAYQGITYTTREKAVDIGPVQVTTERTRSVPLSPVVGVIALIGGIALLTINAREA